MSLHKVLHGPTPGWRYDDASQSTNLAQLAVEICYWSLYEVENSIWRLTYKPDDKRPGTEWLKPQGKFSHLFREENASMLSAFQQEVDKRWNELLARCGEQGWAKDGWGGLGFRPPEQKTARKI